MKRDKLILAILADLSNNGVEEIDLTSLEHKLYFYANDDEYKDLFSDVLRNDEENRISIPYNLVPGVKRIGDIKRHSIIPINFFLGNKNISKYLNNLGDNQELIDKMVSQMVIDFDVENDSKLPLIIINKKADCFISPDMVVSPDKERGILQLVTDGISKPVNMINNKGVRYKDASYSLCTFLRDDGETELVLETTILDKDNLEILSFIGNKVINKSNEYNLINEGIEKLKSRKENYYIDRINSLRKIKTD